MNSIRLGPLLGFEGTRKEGERYSFCFLSSQDVKRAELRLEGMDPVPFERVCDTATSRFWRATRMFPLKEATQTYGYEIACDGQVVSNKWRSIWRLRIAAAHEEPKFAYASCNGFGHGKTAKKCTDHHVLWRKMRDEHRKAPYAMLLMGGDQLYADTVWGELNLPPINRWPQLSPEQQQQYSLTPELQGRMDAFYEALYIESWGHEEMAEIMAEVPNAMMWDDHDIYDGWGSFPDELLQHPIYRALYDKAEFYFSLFQMRSSENTSRIRKKGAHFSFAFKYRNYHVLALDQRSGRTIDTVMTRDHWADLETWMKRTPAIDNLLVLIAVPLVYRSFRLVEWLYERTRKIEEMEDDVHDHWSAIRHRDERGRMVSAMVELARKATGKVVVLSGDVHVGGIGKIYDFKENNEILQVISSGIMNLPPTLVQWLFIKLMTTDDRLYFNNGEIQSKLKRARGALSYIRDRNYATLKLLKNGRLRVRWHCAKRRAPRYLF